MFIGSQNSPDYSSNELIKKIKWVDEIKILGIYFTRNVTNITDNNLEKKLSTLVNEIAQWKRRYITPIGKITIIKSLLLSKLVHIFVALPNLSRALTRALERGEQKMPPSCFSRIAEKRRRAAPPFFQYLLRIELDTLCKHFNPRSPKVRSPGQVKVKNGFLTLRLRSGHTRYPIGFKPSVFHKMIDTYNFFISDFLYL